MVKDRRGRKLKLPEGDAAYALFFRKIQEAAVDGQNGSATYALDRLMLIQALATTALQKIEELADGHNRTKR